MLKDFWFCGCDFNILFTPARAERSRNLVNLVNFDACGGRVEILVCAIRWGLWVDMWHGISVGDDIIYKIYRSLLGARSEKNLAY